MFHTKSLFRGGLHLDTTQVCTPSYKSQRLAGKVARVHRKQKLHSACQWKAEPPEQHYLTLPVIYPFTITFNGFIETKITTPLISV